MNSVFSDFIKEVEESVNEKCRHLPKSKDWADFRFRCGELLGLQLSIGILREFIATKEKTEDSDR